jgi:hypothetical protein
VLSLVDRVGERDALGDARSALVVVAEDLSSRASDVVGAAR